MDDLFDKLCRVAEKENPEFDRNNAKDLSILEKCFVLSVAETKSGKEIKEDYMKEVVEKKHKKRIEKMIKERGHSIIKYELDRLNLEKEILERKIKITKNFLN